jgi:glutathione synthase/RimK-type ligase-like ATP-grasp enzyme
VSRPVSRPVGKSVGKSVGRAARVAYVTYRQEPDRPDPDIDIPLALPALAAVGLAADVVVWDDDGVDWSGYDAALLRSVWDYVPRFADFMTWARRVSSQTLMLPPLAVIEHNTDKHYLADLADAGVPVVPTHWVAPGEPAELTALAWPRLVVKPAVSSGSRDTIVTSDRSKARDQVAAILASGRSALVQPYLAAVDHEGEVSVVVLGGTPSHAVRKVPALTVGGYGDASEAVEVTADLVAATRRALAAQPLADGLPWARVDLVRERVGRPWMVMELELTEPLLFLGYAPGAPDRFAAAVLEALAGAG